jgi:hypothetical protein
MASARCYTKSGSVEKYESNLWVSPTAGNWSSMGILGTITPPDSNGNYTVTPEQHFEDSSDTTTYSCFTEYGGVKKTFYFKKKNSDIVIRVHVSVIGYNYNGFIAFDCSVEGEVDGFHTNTADKIANNILEDNLISLYWTATTNNGPLGPTNTTTISAIGQLILNTGKYYDNGTQYYIDGAHPPYCSPSSGMYNGGKDNWEIRVTTIT